MKIFIGSDHTGFELKNILREYLIHKGYSVEDIGPYELDPDDDYPTYVYEMTNHILGSDDKDPRGIFIGGSGQGEAIASNRVAGIRAAVFYGAVLPKSAVDISGRESHDKYEIPRLAREHNNTNVLTLGVRFITPEEAKEAVKVWLKSSFSDNERYARRIKQVEDLYG